MVSSKDAIDKITADGWYFVEQQGSHRHYKHPTKKGKVTIKINQKDIAIGTVRSIEKQSGVKLR